MNGEEFLQTVWKFEFSVLFYTRNDRFHQVYYKKLSFCRPTYQLKVSVWLVHNFLMERNFDKRFSKLNSSCFFTLGMIVSLIDFKWISKKLPPWNPCYIDVTWNHNFWTERNFYKRFENLNSAYFLTSVMLDFIKFTIRNYHFVARHIN